jgi:hypothetical protein
LSRRYKVNAYAFLLLFVEPEGIFNQALLLIIVHACIVPIRLYSLLCLYILTVIARSPYCTPLFRFLSLWA